MKITLSSCLKIMNKIFQFPFLLSIRLYQKTLSPDHGFLKHWYPYGYCKYTPTCSQYGYESIKKFGVVKGSMKTIWRILRCNPWSHGGLDQP